MTRPADIYRKTQAETISPMRLVVMCYEAIVKDLQEAKKFHQERNIEALYDKVRHAQDLITELLIGLDYEQGGEIAVNLGRIYNFILRQLIAVNTRTSPEYYDPLIEIMSDLKEAWEQIARQAPSQAQGSIKA
ncbi:MAG: flagellar export chaperone FliS [Syntrophobacterales bacterium]|nr:flagellar export chaperone FliS [Syntrophobacterales bacterium]